VKTGAWIAIVLAVTAVSSTTAAADPDRERARELYRVGLAQYQAGDYDGAVETWTEGYALSPAPMFLFNIGQAHRFDGDCVKALRYYAEYRRAAPKPTNADELAQAEALCADAAPAEDSEAAADADTDAATDVDEADDAGDARANYGAPRRRGGARRIATWTIGAAGLIATGVGLAFGADAWTDWRAVEDACGADLHCDDDASLARARELQDEARATGNRATILVGVGVAAIATAVVLHVTAPRGVEVVPRVSTDGAALVATGRF
jgi:hypothetical protein